MKEVRAVIFFGYFQKENKNIPYIEIIRTILLGFTIQFKLMVYALEITKQSI